MSDESPEERSPLQKVPDKADLEKLLEDGKTQKEIAEEYGVSRSAIGMAMARYDLKGKRTRGRYMDMIPWKLSPRHTYHRDAKYLRLEARRRRGGSLTDDELRRLQDWRDELDRVNAVIVYDARTEAGFFWLPRKDSDDDILRRPQV